MNEQKKDTALDEEALEGVTGGDYGPGGVYGPGGAYGSGGAYYGDRIQGFIDRAWDKILENESANDNKEQQP